MSYDFQKSRVTGPWDHMVSVSAKKSNKINLCTCVPLRFCFNYVQEFGIRKHPQKSENKKWRYLEVMIVFVFTKHLHTNFYKVKLGSAETIVLLLFILTTNNQKQDFLSLAHLVV
jgi:hypothetical protein